MVNNRVKPQGQPGKHVWQVARLEGVQKNRGIKKQLKPRITQYRG